MSYPVSADVVVPDPPPHALPAASAALVEARDAYRTATEAAVQHAVAQAALRIVDAEEAATRHRLRALTSHWIPRLTSALAASRLGLEEQEHEDAVRLRWAHTNAGAAVTEQAQGAR